jgi:hypothetical protein
MYAGYANQCVPAAQRGDAAKRGNFGELIAASETPGPALDGAWRGA